MTEGSYKSFEGHLTMMNRRSVLSLLVLLILLLVSPLAVDAQCEDEETSLEDCAQDALPEELREDDGPPPLDNVQEACSTQVDNFENCLTDDQTDSNDPPHGCQTYLWFWQNFCIPLYPLSCLLNCEIRLDSDCEDFEENLCHRQSCCSQCQEYLEEYADCVVNDRELCDVELPKTDCEKERGVRTKAGVILGIVLGTMAGVALLIGGLFYVQQEKRGQKEKEEEMSPPAPSPAVGRPIV
jgi:hypothetical protein